MFSLLHGASKSFLLIVNSVEAKGIGSLCSKLPCGQRNPLAGKKIGPKHFVDRKDVWCKTEFSCEREWNWK